MNYIDLFSGAGGMSLGFEKLGFKELLAIEYDPTAVSTYKKNFPNNRIICRNIKEVRGAEVKKIVKGKKVDLVIGGPPCQGFSIAGNVGRKFIDDDRNYLFKEFVRIVRDTKPKMFVMENVARMATHNQGKTIKDICKSFQKIGYEVQYKVLNAVNYNVPQNRRRLFVVGTTGPSFSFPAPIKDEGPLTVESAISDLPPLKSGEKSSIPNHTAMNHTEQMLKKMHYVKEGGNRYDIPENIRPKTGDIRKYIRYDRNKPSITVTGDMRKVFHYCQNRALTPRELARLQTFPDNFIFEGSSISIQQQIGNAVPPILAAAIAKEVKNCLLKM